MTDTTRFVGVDSTDPWLPDIVKVRADKAKIDDAAGNFTATDVEGALAELVDQLDTIVITGGAMPAASDAETIAGVINDKAVTPAGLKVQDEAYDVRISGAVLDNTTDDTTAIQAALTIVGTGVGAGSTGHRGVLKFPHKSQCKAVGLVVPDRVIVEANGSRIQANAAGTIMTLGLSSELRDATIVGMGAGTANDGVKADGYHAVIRDCLADNLSGRAFILSENGCYLIDSFAQNCLLGAATLVAPTGVVEIEDTDCWIRGGEYTASRTTLSASGFAYAIAVQSTGVNSIIEGAIAEVSDHGVYIAGSITRLIGVRADLNRGHGFVLASGSSQLVGCLAVSNGRQTTNTYDGFTITGGVHVFTGCMASSTGNTHRYGFNDASVSGSNWSSFDAANQALGNGTAAVKVDNFAGGHVTTSTGPFLGITAAATTWNVQSNRWPHSNWFFQNTGAVSFTDFTNEVSGMRLSVFGDGFTTLVHNTGTIRMLAAANLLLAANTVYEFVNRNGVWYQT
jgi:hypothetical protein